MIISSEMILRSFGFHLQTASDKGFALNRHSRRSALAKRNPTTDTTHPETMQYRRAYTPGAQYFFTLVTENRRKIFTNDATINTLRQAFRNVMTKRPFIIDAAVIMPEHIHCIWTLPPDDADFSTRWRLIKTWFTKHCDSKLRTPPSENRKHRGEQAIWQHRYWEHMIRDEVDYAHHVDYIHYNPVKHGAVPRPVDWPYSSLHRYIQNGVLQRNWGGVAPDFPLNVGRE